MKRRKHNITQKYLKECLYYDPEVGIFTWRERSISHFNGDKRIYQSWNTKYSYKIAGTKRDKNLDNSYYVVTLNRNSYYLHRLAILYMEGYNSENHIDHIDRNKSNNKYSNLREVSPQCNMQNVGLLKNNTSGVTGVYYNKESEKWVAGIKINRKGKNLGVFDTFNEAVMRRYEEERDNPNWKCSVCSSSYQYLKERELI